ncbi:MAG: polysaccharide deacetylase family protein [Kiritimatiellae bacterium]|nr:polysaccharide deacetylase family protein [Kiritimatiellia bacterium]
MLSVCRFLNNAPCAYSMTYDEGFVDILANALPIHKKYGIPGHADVVVGQLGQRRNCYRSSMNGLFHMGAEHLRYLITEGWSVGNHSWSHFVYPTQPGLDLYREVVYSRYYLEDRIGVPVTFFAIPNNQCNYEPALPFIRQAGYLGCQQVYGGVNRDDVDLLKILNFMVAEGPIKAKAYRWPLSLTTENLKFEELDGGWLCETTHLVMPNVIQPHKNITPEGLERRFVKLLEITDRRLWAATPEDVIDYILLRRRTAIKPAGANEYDVTVDFPVGIQKRQMSFALDDPKQAVKQIMAGDKSADFRREDGKVVFTVADLAAGFVKQSTLRIKII